MLRTAASAMVSAETVHLLADGAGTSGHAADRVERRGHDRTFTVPRLLSRQP